MQVAPIKKVLTSVSKACDAGNVAIFTKDGGCIVKHKDVQELVDKASVLKDKVQLKRERGVYTFDMFIRKAATSGSEVNAISTHNSFAALDEETLFIRQGKRALRM